MMKMVYFVNHDFNMNDRQSDGVEFCVIPEFDDGRVYFYCSEYSMFWDDISAVGHYEKSCGFSLKGKIRPATLAEICESGLCEHVNTIKEYRIENSKVLGIRYIHLDA